MYPYNSFQALYDRVWLYQPGAKKRLPLLLGCSPGLYYWGYSLPVEGSTAEMVIPAWPAGKARCRIRRLYVAYYRGMDYYRIGIKHASAFFRSPRGAVPNKERSSHEGGADPLLSLSFPFPLIYIMSSSLNSRWATPEDRYKASKNIPCTPYTDLLRNRNVDLHPDAESLLTVRPASVYEKEQTHEEDSQTATITQMNADDTQIQASSSWKGTLTNVPWWWYRYNPDSCSFLNHFKRPNRKYWRFATSAHEQKKLHSDPNWLCVLKKERLACVNCVHDKSGLRCLPRIRLWGKLADGGERRQLRNETVPFVLNNRKRLSCVLLYHFCLFSALRFWGNEVGSFL